MNLCLDPEFQAIAPPLTADERAQLEANLRAEGCRDALAIWVGEPPVRGCPTCPPGTPFSRATALTEVTEGVVVWRCHTCDHIERRPWILLDGHTLYAIATTHGLPFEIREVEGVRTREEAVNWIIDYQLGRRNLSAAQKSYLRGKRYNREKQAIPNQEGKNQHRGVADHRDPQPTTAARLAKAYGVGEATIKRDGQFADAVDTLAEAIGPEVRQEVLAAHPTLPRRQVVQSARAVRRLKRRFEAKDFSFLRGLHRVDQRKALRLLAQLPVDEHAAVNALLDQPGLFALDALHVILRRLPAQPPDTRQRLYQLHASADPRDRARALCEAAGGSPVVPPPLRFLEHAAAALRWAVQDLDRCVQLFQTAPWVQPLQALSVQVHALQAGELAQVVAEVEAYFDVGPEVDVSADETIDDAEGTQSIGD
jgi:hypothetical protein